MHVTIRKLLIFDEIWVVGISDFLIACQFVQNYNLLYISFTQMQFFNVLRTSSYICILSKKKNKLTQKSLTKEYYEYSYACKRKDDEN